MTCSALPAPESLGVNFRPPAHGRNTIVYLTHLSVLHVAMFGFECHFGQREHVFDSMMAAVHRAMVTDESLRPVTVRLARNENAGGARL